MLVEIGYIQRTHGIKGEVQLVLNDTLEEIPEMLESVFLEIEGIPTPFFVDYIRQKSDDKIIVKFEDFDSLESAEDLIGYKVFVPNAMVPDTDEVGLIDLVGFTIYSTDNKIIGAITRFDDYGLNAVFAVDAPNYGGEVLIPATDEIIVEFDPDEKTVVMEIPDGLLELGEK